MRALTELVDVARARSGSEFRFEANAVRRHAAICSRPWWQESKKRAKQPKKCQLLGTWSMGVLRSVLYRLWRWAREIGTVRSM